MVFPVHPRTRLRIDALRLSETLKEAGVALLPPLGYLEMLGAMKEALFVLTDSGGIQEETTALGVPCITLRDNTERPITVSDGTNTVTGTDPKRIEAAIDEIFTSGGKAGKIPELWDGDAAARIAEVLRVRFGAAKKRQVA